MRNAWYGLLYHGVGWEDPIATRFIARMHSPDVFRDHLKVIREHGDIVSFEEGVERTRKNKLRRPMFTFWFDDGLASVRRYAFPLLTGHGAVGCTSVCSRFFCQEELFWRSKLSVLYYLDGFPALRRRLRRFGYQPGGSVKRFTLDHFSEDLIDEIDGVYNDYTDESQRDYLMRTFDDRSGTRFLKDAGWTVANHSQAHYPVGEDTAIHRFQQDFEKCEAEIREVTCRASRVWVLPFERPPKRSTHLLETFQQCGDNRFLAFVAPRPTVAADIEQRIIYRLYVPECPGRDLIHYLNTL